MTTTFSKPRIAVLIVEDEGIIALNIQELLTELGYDAFAIASSCEEAVARASERCPDVVLMDIRIAGDADGITTGRIFQERFDVPIIYLTAHADDKTLDRAKQTEPQGYLVKPIRATDLRTAIELACYKHGMTRRLRAQERWFSTTLRSIADAVVTTDLSSKITFLNPAAERLLEVKLEAVKGRPAREVLHLLDADLQPQRDTALDRALRYRQPTQASEAVLKNRTDVARAIADSAAPVIDHGELLGAVMVFRDVTEQKQLRRQLELADRLASLGTMAAGVAHEINNPLAALVANGQYVLEHFTHSGEDEQRHGEAVLALRELLSAATRISQIVADLKAFSRPEPKAPHAVDVNEAVHAAIRATDHEFRHRARLTLELNPVPPIQGDETRLVQVLVNLLVNASHAIVPGNRAGNEIAVNTRSLGPKLVVIEVKDTGSGMSPEVQGKIFDPFFTTKPVGIGTGLGLAISHGIVASFGGSLAVESEPGKGSTFRLSLPAMGSIDTVRQPVTSPTVGDRRARVLLIDDEEIVRKAVTRVLEHHQVVGMSDAKAALSLLESDPRFDVIFCDLVMPNMTGIDFYGALLQQNPALARRVVFLTGGAISRKMEAFLDTVPNRTILKPFEVQSLRAAVQQILALDKSK